MSDWKRRQVLDTYPTRRRGASFNQVMLKEFGRIARAKEFGAVTNVWAFLHETVDRDGYSVATVEQIATETGRSVSAVTVALRKLLAMGRVERVGRSGFLFPGEALRTQNERSWR